MVSGLPLPKYHPGWQPDSQGAKGALYLVSGVKLKLTTTFEPKLAGEATTPESARARATKARENCMIGMN